VILLEGDGSGEADDEGEFDGYVTTGLGEGSSGRTEGVTLGLAPIDKLGVGVADELGGNGDGDAD
jgi:hypothetical protein